MQRSSTYTLKKKLKKIHVLNTYNGPGDLELILISRQLLNLRIIHSGCKNQIYKCCKRNKIK